MNEMPPDKASDEVDDLYRRAAALDPSRPSESTRRSILNHAARVAADRAAQRRPTDTTTARRSVQRPWRIATWGTLAAAVLAGLVVMPRFWNPPPSPLRLGALPSTPLAARITDSRPNASPPADLAQARQDSARREASDPRKSAVVASPQPAPSLPPAKPTQLTLAATLARRAHSSAGSASAYTFGHSSSVEAPRVRASALRRAAQADDIPALNRALAQSVDVNGRDEAGRTALMLAILAGHVDAVDVLLAHGADPSAVDAKGVTPLDAAKNRGEPTIVALLLRAGAR